MRLYYHLFTHTGEYSETPQGVYYATVPYSMNMKVLMMCGAAVCGGIFLGYCVYFDKKRRSDPEYKKKVMASQSNCSLSV